MEGKAFQIEGTASRRESKRNAAEGKVKGDSKYEKDSNHHLGAHVQG